VKASKKQSTRAQHKAEPMIHQSVEKAFPKKTKTKHYKHMQNGKGLSTNQLKPISRNKMLNQSKQAD